MHALFVHSNCPAQFRHIAPGLVERGWQCTFVTANTRVTPGKGVQKLIYTPWGRAVRESDPITHFFQNETAHARGVYEAMKRAKDVKPDLVIAHSGFGSSLFLPHLYDAPIVNFFEYFFRPAGVGQHLGYRPDIAVTEAAVLQSHLRNACFLLDLNNCDRGWCPNRSQFETLPAEYRPKIEVIPEGIDTDFWKPGRRARRRRTLPDGTVVWPGTRIVSYTARGLGSN